MLNKLVTGIIGTAIATVAFLPSAQSQSYDYCYDADRDRYWVGELYEYGHGYPVEIINGYDVPQYSSYMNFRGEVTMYSFTEDRQIMMVNGEFVQIAGLFFLEDCSMQLLVYSPRLELLGAVPSWTVAVP